MKIGRMLCLFAAVAALLLIPGGCRPEKKSSKVRVVVSIGPVGDFVRQVGGNRVEIEVLIPPGSNPHIFEPSPSQIIAVHRAKLIVLVGLNFEFWKNKVLESADNPGLKAVELADGITLVEDVSHRDREHDMGSNPHIWLSPLNAIQHVGKIRDALSEVDPEGKACYAERASAYTGRLEELHLRIQEKVSHFSSRKFIAHHSAWVYFARDYGLEQVAAIESVPGKEPSPAELISIIKNAEKVGARAIFAEQQFSPKAAEAIAAECHCQVLFLDPLGTPPEYDYIACMKNNVEQMEKAMK